MKQLERISPLLNQTYWLLPFFVALFSLIGVKVFFDSSAGFSWLWFANAAAAGWAGLHALQAKRTWPSVYLCAGIFVGFLVGNALAAGLSLDGVFMSLINTLEVGLAAKLVISLTQACATQHIKRLPDLAVLRYLVALGALLWLIALFAGTYFSTRYGAPLFEASVDWFLSGAATYCAISLVIIGIVSGSQRIRISDWVAIGATALISILFLNPDDLLLNIVVVGFLFVFAAAYINLKLVGWVILGVAIVDFYPLVGSEVISSPVQHIVVTSLYALLAFYISVSRHNRNLVNAELRLSQAQQTRLIFKMDALAEQTGIAFWWLDLSTNRMTYSRTFAHRWGLEVGGSITFEEHKSLMSEKLSKLFSDAITQTIDTKEEFRETFESESPRFEKRWFQMVITPEINDQGEVFQVNGTTIDVTALMTVQSELEIERAKLENALAQVERKEWLQNLLNFASESVDLSIFSLDPKTHCIIYNNVFADRWGFERGGELNFNELLKIHSPVAKELFESAINHVTQTKETFKTEFEGRRDGYYGRWYKLVVNPQLDDNNDIVALYFSTMEVTDLLQTRQDLSQKNMLLTDTLAKRNQLFGMVAHELRTPVAAISMMTDQHDAEEWQRDRKAIKRTVSDLLNTIDDMRLLINPELVRPVRLEGFTVSELNASVASSVASIVSATGFTYQQYNAVAMPLTDDEFSTDTYRVRVAVTNIIKNACLHSRGSQVWMVSRMYTDDDGEDFLEWLVADNGVGIPEDQVERLFEAGERGDSEAEGTGLGLHITKSWIEEIGGSVQYRSRAEGGSEFIIRVPLINASDVKRVEPEEDGVDTDCLEALMSQLNVLMVEDEVMLRMLGHKLLSKLVSSVQVAGNGSDGLRAFDPAKHNLVLTDYFMPEMSGVEMSRMLREQGYQGVIIGISAATIGDQREEMLQAGVDMVLPKPLNAEMFKNGIVQLMDDGRFDDLLRSEASSRKIWN